MKRIDEINKQLYELAKQRDFLEIETKFDEYAIYSLDLEIFIFIKKCWSISPSIPKLIFIFFLV